MAGFPSSIQNDLGSWALSGGAHAQDHSATTINYAWPERGARQGASLAKMVEREIIPRLMLAHTALSARPESTADADLALDDGAADTYARMAINGGEDSLVGFAQALLLRGVPIEAVYLDLVVPAARRLGQYWDDDSASMGEVAIGLSRLHQVVRALSWQAPVDAESDEVSRSALFAAGRGERDTLGLFIAEDLFRRAGWRTSIETAMAREGLAETVRSHWFDVLQLGVGRDMRLGDVAETVGAIRQSSLNKGLFLLVSGRMFDERPELAAGVGADATARDAGEALLIAREALLFVDNPVRRVGSGS
jgi:methanogenic corrinoid protein MtbC1